MRPHNAETILPAIQRVAAEIRAEPVVIQDREYTAEDIRRDLTGHDHGMNTTHRSW